MKLAKLLRIIPPYQRIILVITHYFCGGETVYKGRADSIKYSKEYKEVKNLDVLKITPTDFSAPRIGELSLMIEFGGTEE